MAFSDIKFVCKDEVSRFLEKSIKDLMDSSLEISDSSFLPCQITECPRRIIYRSRGEKAISVSSYRSVQEEYLKNKWIALLEKIKSVKILHKDVIASDCNYNLYSKVDAVINIKGDIFAVKTIFAFGKEMDEIREKGAIKKNVIEMVVYIWLLEVDGGILIYESDMNCEYCIFHIKPYKPIIESVMKKCKKLLDFKLLGQIPNRPYKTKAKECDRCEYRDLCWKNK